MNSSLDKLASYKSDLKIVEKEFNTANFALLRRKGVYPYEYIDSEAKLQETQLPPKEEFFSILSNCGISDKDCSACSRGLASFRLQKSSRLHADLHEIGHAAFGRRVRELL